MRAVTCPDRQRKDRKSREPSPPSAASSSRAARGDGSHRKEIQRACRRARFPTRPFRPRESGLAIPPRLVQRRDPLREGFGVPLVRRDRFRYGRSGLGDVAHLSQVDELAGVVELAREEPHEIAGGRRARMRPVVCLIGGDRFHDADELRLLRLEAFLVGAEFFMTLSILCSRSRPCRAGLLRRYRRPADPTYIWPLL